MMPHWRLVVTLASFVVFSALLRAQAPTAAGVEPLDVVQLRSNFYMLAGAGGNIAVQIGSDGVLLVNTGATDAAERVLAAIQKITDKPISYIINTNAHSDYVGGNAWLAKAGRSIFTPLPDGATGPGEPAAVVASEPILLRMSAPNGQTSRFPSEMWPSDTFAEPRKDVFFNKEGIQVLQMPAAHSDADSVVLFRGSEVVVTGEIIDTTRFPAIDLANGGSIQGEIDALNEVIDLGIRALPFVDAGGGTLYVPGRGRVLDKLDVVEYRDMVVTIRDVIQHMIQRRMTLAQIKAASPAKPYEPRFGGASGPWTTEDFVEAVYHSLTVKK